MDMRRGGRFAPKYMHYALWGRVGGGFPSRPSPLAALEPRGRPSGFSGRAHGGRSRDCIPWASIWAHWGGQGGGCRLGLIEPPSLVARLGGESQQRPVSYVNSSLFTESVCNQLSATEERESAQRA